MHSQLQPFSQPSLNALVGLCIDVLSSVDIDSHTKCMRWFQGKVLRVVQDAHHPTVEVDWDPTPDVTGYEDGGGLKSKYCCLVNGTRTIKLVLGEWILM